MEDYMATFEHRFFLILGCFLEIVFYILRKISWIGNTPFEIYQNIIFQFLCVADIFYSKHYKKVIARPNIPIPPEGNNAPNVENPQNVIRDETRRLSPNNERRNSPVDSSYRKNISGEYKKKYN